MGADLIIYDLPACKITDERSAALALLIEQSKAEEMPEPHEDVDDYKSGLFCAAKQYESAAAFRDVVRLHVEGCPYRLFITGGLSWGDDPTESSTDFSILAEHDEICKALRLWAIEDFNAELAGKS